MTDKEGGQKFLTRTRAAYRRNRRKIGVSPLPGVKDLGTSPWLLNKCHTGY